LVKRTLPKNSEERYEMTQGRVGYEFIINCLLFTSQDKSVQMLIGTGFYEGRAAPLAAPETDFIREYD